MKINRNPAEKPKKTDALGAALLDYITKKNTKNITIISSVAEDDELPLPYLFRSEKELPKIEKKALQLCKGNVLDIGAGSGVHSLILQKRGLKVTSIDTSEGAIETMKQRGVINPLHKNFFTLENQKYDTLLFLMNGVGIAQTLDGLTHFLTHCKSLLSENGQILLDSSDIKYMFEEEDGSILLDLNGNYYGEVMYQMSYKNCKTPPFSWLFVDFETLQNYASQIGLTCELIIEGNHFDYLARITG
ncbi:MAG: SAM-dependent methyltransferase [Bacteroidetes bacterium HGW-Bacteroidetes-12]|nr:MAG: SAM-dependent methyltransferase [Bacteroidetes bacterium HGW-Bacteroidetes-12]